MAVLNVENSFLTENRSVYTFLNQPGQGLYIPLYQRDYSWDSDNIEQLLEDLARGIQRIALGEVRNNENKEIRFLGTIITVIESNRQNIYPVDPQAVPSKIEKLIDGQQRISTIALMATLLTKRLTEIKKKIKSNNPIYEQVKEICDIWIDQKLSTIFSFDLGRGEPRLKPKIVRGAKDYWTRKEDVETAYKSELSNYLGHFIQAYTDKTAFPCLSRDKYGNTLFFQNGKRIESWLKNVVSKAHENNIEEEFVSALDIINNFSQELLWEFDRPNLVEIIREENFTDKKSNSYILCELVQVLSVCHYLLDRCCFTIIQPTDDDWAFDMFQSLNATGTPLTAIETFKPTVVNTMDSETGKQFKDSMSESNFKKIEDFLTEATSAPQKNKRTNDFLTSFFVAYDGRTISSHFSYQRKSLDSAYNTLVSFHEKDAFIRKMGNYAEFYNKWLSYNGENGVFPCIETSSEADLVSMLILFLKASNHKMAITVLASAYDSVISGQNNATEEFTGIVKMIAAYYFLWRATYPNAGLDTTYRDFFKKMPFAKNSPTMESVKSHFKEMLAHKDIDTCDKWKDRAKTCLSYKATGREILRLALLVSAHDTTTDDLQKGLMKIGRDNVSSYLSRTCWLSSDLKTIEHIAPQANENDSWDLNLYDTQTELCHSLGNLTLWPQDLNSSAGNKGWKAKCLYYKAVAESDPDKLREIDQVAGEYGISLNRDTVKLLKESSFNRHLEPLASLSADDIWDKELVERRTDRMLEIVWDRVAKWILG